MYVYTARCGIKAPSPPPPSSRCPDVSLRWPPASKGRHQGSGMGGWGDGGFFLTQRYVCVHHFLWLVNMNVWLPCMYGCHIGCLYARMYVCMRVCVSGCMSLCGGGWTAKMPICPSVPHLHMPLCFSVYMARRHHVCLTRSVCPPICASYCLDWLWVCVCMYAYMCVLLFRLAVGMCV